MSDDDIRRLKEDKRPYETKSSGKHDGKMSDDDIRRLREDR